MSMGRRNLVAHLGWLLVPPLFAGCVPIPYAYPTVSQVPAVQLGPERDEVHVFRVDIADDQSCVEFADKQRDHYVLSQVLTSPAGEVPSQKRVALESGWYWNLIAVSYQVHTHRTLCVRLYRPGFRTIELTPGDKPEKIAWHEAIELAAQEKAVDDLLSTNGTNAWAQWKGGWGISQLDGGATSPAHKGALLFAAAEYERLAGKEQSLVEEFQGLRERLTRKANWLRALAGNHKKEEAPTAKGEEPADKKPSPTEGGTEVFDPFKEHQAAAR